jgi:hypothetical protein
VRDCIREFVCVCEGQSRCERGEREVVQVYVRAIIPPGMRRMLIICYIHDRDQLSWEGISGGYMRCGWQNDDPLQLACDCCWLELCTWIFIFFEKVQRNDAAS